jgi:hypothetical protein
MSFDPATRAVRRCRRRRWQNGVFIPFVVMDIAFPPFMVGSRRAGTLSVKGKTVGNARSS